ncbi:MAG TPA: PsbP-related protein [Ktedonobacterales bacterium]
MAGEYDKYSGKERNATDAPPYQRMLTPRVTFIVALVCTLIASSLLFVLADSGHITAEGQLDSTPTAAAPTVTVSPTVAALGFQLYTDHSDGFTIQYPNGWIASPLNPGMQFADDGNETGYALQVALPGASALVNPPQNVADPSAWAQYELNYLQSKYPQNFIPLTDGQTSREIGGVTWQGGAGLITNNSAGIRVQVFATVYKGRPYIINLLSISDRFTAGMIEFFSPMLDSYIFITPTT